MLIDFRVRFRVRMRVLVRVGPAVRLGVIFRFGAGIMDIRLHIHSPVFTVSCWVSAS